MFPSLIIARMSCCFSSLSWSGCYYFSWAELSFVYCHRGLIAVNIWLDCCLKCPSHLCWIIPGNYSTNWFLSIIKCHKLELGLFNCRFHDSWVRVKLRSRSTFIKVRGHLNSYLQSNSERHEVWWKREGPREVFQVNTSLKVESPLTRLLHLSLTCSSPPLTYSSLHLWHFGIQVW